MKLKTFCFFWHNKTQKERVFTRSINHLIWTRLYYQFECLKLISNLKWILLCSSVYLQSRTCLFSNFSPHKSPVNTLVMWGHKVTFVDRICPFLTIFHICSFTKHPFVRWKRKTYVPQVFIRLHVFERYTYISMTSLLAHNVAHSTRHSFRPKTNNQPLKKFMSLSFSWVKVVKNWTSF